jgi:RHS repeat-associated protein
MIRTGNGYFDYSTNKYYFYTRDHLGNNRVVADKDVAVTQSTQYYPFGMAFATSTGQNVQAFKYNDKELDLMHNLNMYDYSARYIDMANPRFMTIDPLAEKYYSVSPYAYCLNNPVNRIDPDGRDVWEVNGQGEVVKRIKDKTQDAFYMVAKDDNGKYQRTKTTDADGNETYNSVSFEYGTVTDAKKAGWFRDATSFSVANESSGANLFKFFADNTKIEFGLIHTQSDGSTVMTNHKEGEVNATMTALKLSEKGQTVTSILHNHPNNSQPSGFRVGDTKGDKFAADYLPNVDRYVYQPQNNALVMYDNQSIMGPVSWNLVFSPVTITAKRIPVAPVRRYPGVGLPPP